MSNINGNSSEDDSSSHQIHNESSDEDTLDEIETNFEKKLGRKGKGKIYIPFLCFKEISRAQEQLKNGLFDCKWRKLNECNDTLWYMCNGGCKKRCKLVMTRDETNRCTFFIDSEFFNESGNHDDKQIEKPTIGLPEHVKLKIIEYDRLNIKPMAIIEHLRSDGIVSIKHEQLYNFLKIQRRKNLGSTKFSLQDLVDWANQHSSIPTDENSTFVYKFEHATQPNREFRIFLTTKRLISFTKYVS